MKNTVKLLGSVTIVAALAACTGTTVPGGTGTDIGQPGFTVRVTKNGTGVKDANIFLKKFNGGTVGGFANGTAAGTSVKTGDNGIVFVPVPADAAAAGGLFGIAYDKANAQFGGNAENASAVKNPDEIQWFTTPAYDMAKTKTVSVNIELGWNTNSFAPANGNAVAPGKITFTLPTRSDAKEYEVVVNKGTVAGSGEKAFSSKAATPSIVWDAATAGEYNYTGKFFTTDGMGQASSSALLFSVKSN